MELEGWNSIPMGAGAVFDTRSAPLWLRVLFHLPVVDRFAYPRLVAHGLGSLEVGDPDLFDADAARAKGWRILPQGHVAPGSRASLGSGADPVDAHMARKARRRRLMPQQYVAAGIGVAILLALMIALVRAVQRLLPVAQVPAGVVRPRLARLQRPAKVRVNSETETS